MVSISAAAVFLLLLLTVSACVARYGFPAPIQARLDIRPDQNAKQGTLSARTPQPVEPGNFRVVLNQLPTIEEGSRSCNIEYENPEENHYSARISLYLDETGQLIGGTRRVDPGYYVEQVQLKQTLPAGNHPITARIELFENQKPAGEMSLEIQLRIITSQAAISTEAAVSSQAAISTEPAISAEPVQTKRNQEEQAG